MKHLGWLIIGAVLIVPGFGGQGPVHSQRCRGEAIAPPAAVRVIATCTRTGWRYRTIQLGPIGHRP